MDATQRWPFEDESASAINSEHFIEHLSLDGARRYLEEAFRVMRPNGVLRTSTPDLRAIVCAYLEDDEIVLGLHRKSYQARDLGGMVNNYIYSHGHQHMYDEVGLTHLLRSAGFIEIERVGFGVSRHPSLKGIDVHDLGELNKIVLSLDAVKPSD
jgi:predicted SAM-dependent methyltransferase